jgi:site-specific recombinase XerD
MPAGRPKTLSLEVAYDSKAWLNFYRRLDSAATKTGYCNDVQIFMTFCKVDNPEKLLAGTTKELEDNILAFIDSQVKQGLGKDIIRRRKAALKKFYDANRIALTWGFISGAIPKNIKRRRKDQAYTHEKIAKMASIADIREKPILMLYTQSGAREAVIPELEIRNLTPIPTYDIYRIVAYEGFDEEYVTYCGTDAKKALDEYFEYRRRCGEVLGPNSPVIREVFNRSNPDDVKRPRKISPKSIFGVLTELAVRAGVREPVKLKEGQQPGSIRHEIKLVHGFRKFFDTQCTNSGINPIWVELLEGRSPKGVKGSYYRPSETELLEGNKEMKGYIHAIDNLTIDPANKLKKEVLELQQKLQDAPTVSMLQDTVAGLSDQLMAVMEEVKRLKSEGKP